MKGLLKVKKNLLKFNLIYFKALLSYDFHISYTYMKRTFSKGQTSVHTHETITPVNTMNMLLALAHFLLLF